MLWYQCAVCKETVSLRDAEHWIDDGTQLFCPLCDGITVVRLTRHQPDAAGSENEKGQALPAARLMP